MSGIPGCTVDLICSFEEFCCVNGFYTWAAPGIGRHITYLVVTGTVLIVVLFLKELRIFDGIFYRSRKMYSGPPPPETEDAVMDSDVRAEKDRIQAMGPGEIRNNNLVVKSMTKYYKSHLAVNQLSLAVQSSVSSRLDCELSNLLTGNLISVASASDCWASTAPGRRPPLRC